MADVMAMERQDFDRSSGRRGPDCSGDADAFTRAFIASPSRSSSRMCDSELPYRVNRVRTPPSTNASFLIDSQNHGELLMSCTISIAFPKVDRRASRVSPAG
jgi:hypothetical protein